MKVRVVSPHLDDAVWSCSGILERHDCTVVTICAGVPPPGLPASDFDKAAGFGSAHDAMLERRQEDAAAAKILGCDVVHLDLLDVSYADGEALAVAVQGQMLVASKANEIVVGPLGLRHPDHQLIATAFRRAAFDLRLPAWVYEELPYAYAWPEYLGGALAMARCGEGTTTRRPGHRKELAVAAYKSQLNAGTHRDAIMAPERYHRLRGGTWMDL